jgi:hypothetical protein
LAGEVLATRAADEQTATRVLETAFAGDTRLAYRAGAWTSNEPCSGRPVSPRKEPQTESDPDRVLVIIEGEPRTVTTPFRLTVVSAVRMRGDLVIGACGGHATDGHPGDDLRRSMLETMEGAVPVVHDPSGALAALEEWLAEPIPPPVSLRELAARRLGLRRGHDLESLVARLGLAWHGRDEPVELAETLDLCLSRLRKPGEGLRELQVELTGDLDRIDWSVFEFDRAFIDAVPPIPGTYRFYDSEGALIYVGKSKNLARRMASYFRDGDRPQRERELLEKLHRIEYEPAGSELEAILREAEQIRRDAPSANVQRHVRERHGRAVRLRSILILEPSEPPTVLRAYLVRDARLVGRVGIGPRGGGLKRIGRILDDYFFSAPAGPTVAPGPGLDVEIVARWLAANRDRVVAFDPTDLGSSDEVVQRLRWFLGHGEPFDSDGSPIITR